VSKKRVGVLQIGLMLWLGILVGCAVKQPYALQPVVERSNNGAVVLHDLRRKNAQVSVSGQRNAFSHWYADDAFVPDRMRYLQQCIENHTSIHDRLGVTITGFDIGEVFTITPTPASQPMTFAGVFSLNPNVSRIELDGPQYYSVPKRDLLVVGIKGEVNSQAFDFQIERDVSAERYFQSTLGKRKVHLAISDMINELAQQIVARARGSGCCCC